MSNEYIRTLAVIENCKDKANFQISKEIKGQMELKTFKDRLTNDFIHYLVQVKFITYVDALFMTDYVMNSEKLEFWVKAYCDDNQIIAFQLSYLFNHYPKLNKKQRNQVSNILENWSGKSHYEPYQ